MLQLFSSKIPYKNAISQKINKKWHNKQAGTMTPVVNNPVIERLIKIAKLDLVMTVLKNEKEVNEQ
ncbi:hypothetical protein [Bacillus alveayuensis]|uniref:hypothetical protein n=1 Tax=Aeribacillus alveayuensis TaxID=279215 RepID=UPI0005D12546|nr:hypothetical protein [Bacillus alveayuensis]